MLKTRSNTTNGTIANSGSARPRDAIKLGDTSAVRALVTLTSRGRAGCPLAGGRNANGCAAPLRDEGAAQARRSRKDRGEATGRECGAVSARALIVIGVAAAIVGLAALAYAYPEETIRLLLMLAAGSGSCC